jgi:poly(3-hydroxybutyrate) depolymerase
MGAKASLLLRVLVLIALALGSGCRSRTARLPALGADISQTSVSGLSSGGYMAGQFHVAHSGTVTGAAILAAGPFGCAKSPAAEATPYFPAALAYNLAQALNRCMASNAANASVLDSKKLLRRAAALAEDGSIGPLANLRRSKVYLYTGGSDHTVATAVVEAARDFYLAAGVPEDHVQFIFKEHGGHAFLTAGHGNACEKSEPPYVNDCRYDQAGAILSWFYGPLAPKGEAKDANFLTFAQSDYAQPDALLADAGTAYVPAACHAQPRCRVHIVFHGCKQSQAEAGSAVVRDTGYADWAETNNLIIIFPQAAPSPLNPMTCWDWWGYTGRSFLTREAPQIKAVAAMLSRLGQPAP